jgi:hypothetical protein
MPPITRWNEPIEAAGQTWTCEFRSTPEGYVGTCRDLPSVQGQAPTPSELVGVMIEEIDSAAKCNQ